MPQCTNVTTILNMPRVLNMQKCKTSDYDRVLKMLALHSVLDMPEYALIEF